MKLSEIIEIINRKVNKKEQGLWRGRLNDFEDDERRYRLLFQNSELLLLLPRSLVSYPLQQLTEYRKKLRHRINDCLADNAVVPALEREKKLLSTMEMVKTLSVMRRSQYTILVSTQEVLNSVRQKLQSSKSLEKGSMYQHKDEDGNDDEGYFFLKIFKKRMAVVSHLERCCKDPWLLSRKVVALINCSVKGNNAFKNDINRFARVMHKEDEKNLVTCTGETTFVDTDQAISSGFSGELRGMWKYIDAKHIWDLYGVDCSKNTASIVSKQILKHVEDGIFRSDLVLPLAENDSERITEIKIMSLNVLNLCQSPKRINSW